MEIETKLNVPAGFPYAGKVFLLQSLAEGKFLLSNGFVIEALADQIDKNCLFQLVALPTNEIKIFSIAKQMFVSAIGPTRQLAARVQDERWSRFTIEYLEAIGAFTIKSSHPSAAASPYVSVVGPGRNLYVCDAAPQQGWSYFQPFVPTGMPATNVDQFMP
ncbi:hypothetical protein [Pseudomonas sp. Bc-h]|uniref:fascin domain-containing protein n=1 Tax=Pseudomonas sp. Bc-h TaxID=1943632 RepID=UPI0011798E58|nr:hypothetical protein [Pseudomonas sp. Bc-h]